MLSENVIDLGSYRALRDGRGDVPANDPGAATTVGATRIEISIPEEIYNLKATMPSVGVRRRRMLVTIVLSVFAHTALAALLMWSPLQDNVGIGGQELEAVSVEIVAAAALESLMANVASETGRTSAPVEVASGSGVVSNQVEVAAERSTSAEELIKEQPAALLKSDPNSEAPSDVATAEIIKLGPEPPKPELVTDAKLPVPESGKDQNNVAAQAEIVAGGATAQSSAENGVAEGRTGASAGQLTKFAMEVRMALGRSRPKHDGLRGRALIIFALSDAGGIRFADIAKSSGSERLDRLALRAVETATLPKPPTGLTDAQRTYTVPFEFK